MTDGGHAVAGANGPILEACRLAYSGHSANNRESLLSFISPDIILEFPDSLPYGGRFCGIEAFRAYWANLYENYFDSFTYDAHAVLDAGTHIIVPVHAKARAKNGRESEMENCILFEVSGGMIVKARIYADTARGRDLIASPS